MKTPCTLKQKKKSNNNYIQDEVKYIKIKMEVFLKSNLQQRITSYVLATLLVFN